MAYKEKEHDYKKLERDLADGVMDDKRVVMLYGREDYLVRSYEKRLIELYVQPAASGLDYVKLDGEMTSVDDIISHVDTLPMMSQKRVVTIYNYPATMASSQRKYVQESGESSFNDADTKKLTEYLDIIPHTSLLIFAGDSVDTRKALCKKISKIGKSYNFEKLDRKDLSGFIKKRFKGEKKIADDSIIREIINTTGYFDRDSDYSLNSIVNDVVKISSFSQKQIITQADVSNVLSTSLETDAFALLDSLSGGNKGDAMLLVNNIMGNGESGFKLLGLIISQFELMLGIKEYSARKMGKKEIMNEMGIKSEFRYNKVSRYLTGYTVDKLENTLRNLYDVEKNIKTGIYNEKLAMTMFVAGM